MGLSKRHKSLEDQRKERIDPTTQTTNYFNNKIMFRLAFLSLLAVGSNAFMTSPAMPAVRTVRYILTLIVEI